MIKLLTIKLFCFLAICMPVDANAEEIECLAKVVYHEARGEPREGQLAVAHVVMNRVADDRFPDTICEVVFEKRQFTGISKRKNYDNFKGKTWDTSMTSAVLVYLGKKKDNTNGALFYLNPDKVRKKVLTSWKRKYKVLVQINNHKFFGVKS